jgi:hypothetical protein
MKTQWFDVTKMQTHQQTLSFISFVVIIIINIMIIIIGTSGCVVG